MARTETPTPRATVVQRPWHGVSAEEALAALESTPRGLSSAEAEARRAELGENTLPEGKETSALELFLRQFESPLIYVLLVAAGLSFMAGKRFDPYVILGIVVINALIGFVQERHAAQALSALKQLTDPQVTALRDGQPHRIPARALVPGDVLLLHGGDRVGADCRVLGASELSVDESALTGESHAVGKHARPIEGGERVPLGDRRNLVYMGTIVTSGSGTALVVATGGATQMGQIAHEVALGATETPLQRRLAGFSRSYGMVVIGLVLVVAAIALARGGTLIEVFLTALSMAVSAIPEGLPIVISVILAIGVTRMARRKALIRRLPAVEALGSATVIGSDKTGTLTRNEMTVVRACVGRTDFVVSGEGYGPHGAIEYNDRIYSAIDSPGLAALAAVASQCNDASLSEEDGRWTVVGSPTEGALLVLAAKAGFKERWRREGEIPFSSERKWMATWHVDSEGRRRVLVKGAFDRLMPMATSWIDLAGQVQPLDEQARARFAAAAEEMAQGALRVLALAMVPGEGVHPEALSPADVEGKLAIVGLVGMIDPPRPEAIRAIRVCHQAGIQVKMITGDHRTTATAIARQMGLLDGRSGSVLTGAELDELDDDALAAAVPKTDVFARVSPLHKLRIVKSLQGQGEIVAMTGDGVNDAPALNQADIGVAMGVTGTEVAKGASDMVLADDNFVTIVAAVEEGRVIAGNLRKVIQYLLTTSAGEILTILAAILLGYPLPLVAVQILWINLVTDGVMDKTLALEKGEPDLMRRPPRPPKTPLLSRDMLVRLLAFAGYMAAGTLAVYAWDLARGAAVEHARTMAFTTLVAFQWASAFAFRSFDKSLFTIGWTSNRWMLLGLAIGFVLQMAAIYWGPLALVFQTRPLAPLELALTLAVAASLLVYAELYKLAFERRR